MVGKERRFKIFHPLLWLKKNRKISAPAVRDKREDNKEENQKALEVMKLVHGKIVFKEIGDSQKSEERTKNEKVLCWKRRLCSLASHQPLLISKLKNGEFSIDLPSLLAKIFTELRGRSHRASREVGQR